MSVRKYQEMEVLKSLNMEGFEYVAVKIEPPEAVETEEPAVLQAQPHENQKLHKESLVDEARGAVKYAKSITHSSHETDEDIFGRFVASELQQLSSKIRQETKAKIMRAVVEGMKKQSTLSHKTVPQTSSQNLLSTVPSPGTSTANSVTATTLALPTL